MAPTCALRLDRDVPRTPAIRHATKLLLAAALSAATGCGLLPTRDDITSAGSFVKDHVTGKARTDRINKDFAEARILERRQDYAGAEKLYRQVLEEEPRHAHCYHRLAVMAATQGKYQDAHAFYAQALQCGNPTADLWSDIGWCHYMQQQLPEAEAALRNALQVQPQHRGALNNLAMVVGEKGGLDEAYQLFRKGGSEAEADCNFGYLCAQMGDLPRAQQHFSLALSKDPEMRPAADAMLQVTGAMQQQMAAQEAAGQTEGAQSGAVVQAGGQAQAPAGAGVQNVAHQQPVGGPPRRPLIEVFRPGPRSAPSGQPAPLAPTAPQADPAASAGAPASAGPPTGTQPGLPPTQPFQLIGNASGRTNNALPAYQPVQTTSVQPGVVPSSTAPSAQVIPTTAPQPYSMPNQPLPQYLQPGSTPVAR